MDPLTLTGLALLPKIPAMWNSISSIFKKKIPKSESEAIELSKEISNLYKKGEIDPTVQLQLEKIIRDNQAQMSMIALEKEKLFYGELDGLKELEIAAYNSGDKYISQTRPMILRNLFKLTVFYCLFAPLCILAAHSLKMNEKVLLDFIGIIKWIGGFVFSTFISGYLGYSAARTIDKRSPEVKDANSIIGKVVKNFLVK